MGVGTARSDPSLFLSLFFSLARARAFSLTLSLSLSLALSLSLSLSISISLSLSLSLSQQQAVPSEHPAIVMGGRALAIFDESRVPPTPWQALSRASKGKEGPAAEPFEPEQVPSDLICKHL